MNRVDLGRLYEPRGIAFVGASEDLSRYNGRTPQYAIDSGFDGGLYPVNPKYTSIFGRPCYPSLEAIEGPVDVVVALVAPHRMRVLYQSMQSKGVGFLVVLGDLVDRNSSQKSTELEWFKTQIQSGGPRIIGPECAGFYSPHLPLAAGISSSLQVGPAIPGHIGVISQSGGIVGVLFDRARHYGTGFSRITATGGDVDITLLDHFEFMIDEPLTRCISLCFEELVDYERFFSLAQAARDVGKPVIVLKTGRTREAAQTVLSHSGRITGPWDVQQAAFRRYGIVLAQTIDDMHLGASLLAKYRVDPESGVGALACSGGYEVVPENRTGC